MWKESYCLGESLIDKQHMELFKMVAHLVEIVQNGKEDKKRECISAIAYMKDYTLQHFKDEEDYQQRINYPYFLEHKDIHQKFTKTILHHEQKMIKSEFDEKHIKDFMGTLIAWLVYHVAGTDQEIKLGNHLKMTFKHKPPVDKYFNVSATHTLNKIIGRNIVSSTAADTLIDDLQAVIVVKMNMRGNVSGKVVFKYTKKLAFELVKAMSAFTPKSIDELVCSTMAETSNIITNNALKMMKPAGILCETNSPIVQMHPAFLASDNGVIFDTGIGVLEMTTALT